MQDRTANFLHRYLKRLLLGLVAATLAALVWQNTAGEAVLEIVDTADYEVSAVDDRAVANEGGTSVAVVQREDGKLILECDIGTGYQWPFCEVVISLRTPPEGIDLRRYERVRFRVSTEGPSEPQLRFFIRNYNPAYSTPDSPASLKVMELLFVGDDTLQDYSARLSQLTVASWWTNTFRTSLEHAGIDYSNVPQVSISTGGHMEPGKHRIVVDSITFTGQKISDAQLRLIIIIMWVCSIVGYLIVDALVTRRQLILSRQKHLSLRKINEALLLESKSYEKMAHHDALTGVLNRHGLRNMLLDAAQLNDPRLFPLSLVFLDIDHFKKMNDTLGHGAGDEVLRELATLIKAQIKQNDLITRWGGEEFLLIFPGANASQTASVIGRIRDAMKMHPWPNELKVTCSFGITEAKKGEDLSAAIERADEAMYRAKRNGRDRVETNL